MFPANENLPRFIWVPGCGNEKLAVRRRDLIVAPDGGKTKWFVGGGGNPGELGFRYYRGVGDICSATIAWSSDSQQNRSLGLLLSGQPARCLKGHLLLFADNSSPEESRVPGDCLPADLPKVLRRFVRRESVKYLLGFNLSSLHFMITGSSFEVPDEEDYPSELDEDEDDRGLDGSDDAGVKPDLQISRIDKGGG